MKAATCRLCGAKTVYILFQSTPPVKAATMLRVRQCLIWVFQSTPPVKAATLPETYFACCAFISIHAAREGGDGLPNCSTKLFAAFQSTPPVKAATARSKIYHQYRLISIHAAREGGDPTRSCGLAASDISIHAAREGGDCSTPHSLSRLSIFQSTPPVKAAT